MEDSMLTAKHGTELPFTCPKKQVKQNVNTKAHCEDGKIIFSSDDLTLSSSTCSKIG